MAVFVSYQYNFSSLSAGSVAQLGAGFGNCVLTAFKGLPKNQADINNMTDGIRAHFCARNEVRQTDVSITILNMVLLEDYNHTR